MRLSESFLAPYRKKGDLFPNLLSRSTYLSKYSRQETWTDTVRRSVEGNCSLDPNVTIQEAEALYDAIWRGKGLPPGRGLWTGGVPGIPVAARYNCWATEIRSTDDWRWTALMLMCGGGVGLSLSKIHQLPVVSTTPARLYIVCSKSHPDHGDVNPDEVIGEQPPMVLVEDSREGWANTFKTVLDAAFEGRSLIINVSGVREYGAPLKTFGGQASGPGALVSLLRNSWAIIRRRAGQRLTSVDCLDITNHTGIAIRAGGARRSALIVLGNATDTDFRRAKHDLDALMSHRSSSNNSIIFEHERDFLNFDYDALVEDMAGYGEPGLVNLWKMRLQDPHIIGVNPCAELGLHHREACCLSEVYPHIAGRDTFQVLKLMTRYTLRQRLEPMEDPIADNLRKKTMRLGVGLGGLCDFDWTKVKLTEWWAAVRHEANTYADDLGVARPIATTTVKPSGTISLLNGSSPGIHAPYAPYYIRRTRISEKEPMAEALIDAGVPYGKDPYDSTGRTYVFEFPMSAKASIYATTESVGDQIRRLVAVQEAWADNAVSTTVSFNADEKHDLALLLKAYTKDYIKSISCLPRSHGYAMAPYEEIDEATFKEMSSTINFDHPLTHGGDLEIEECAGGACPIR